jgi:predicted DNA-binding transcriptional regulator YafY
MPKNDNMLAILWMLNTGAKLTAKQIAEKLEIHIRTVYRYIDALATSGVPIQSDTGHNGGYRLLNQHIRAPLLFDLEEKKALLHAADFAKEAGYPLSKALDKATAKLMHYSNPEQANTLVHQQAGVQVHHTAGAAGVQPVLLELEQAVSGQCSLEIAYRSSHEKQPRIRVINPYGIVYWNNKWYTVAFCHQKQDIRSFRADRIVSLRPTATTFQRPEGFSARNFFLNRLLPDLGTTGGRVTLVVAGNAGALDDLCLHWYMGHYLQERLPQQATFVLDEPSLLQYAAYYLMGYGKSIQVIEPQSVKDKLVEITSDLLCYYQHQPPTSD